MAAVSAERGNIADQGVVELEQVKAVGQAVGVFFRLAAHVGQGAAQRGGALMGLAARAAVGDVVDAAVLQLVENHAQISAVVGDGAPGGALEREVAPIGP